MLRYQTIIFGHLDARHKDQIDVEEIVQRRRAQVEREVTEARRECEIIHNTNHPDCNICNFSSQ